MTDDEIAAVLRLVRKRQIDRMIYQREHKRMSAGDSYFTHGAMADRQKDQQAKREIGMALNHVITQLAIANQLYAYRLIQDMRAQGMETESVEAELRDIIAGKEVV